ncbi:MAG: FtsW/RodA/SpoVE family cell cycle protein [Kiritimatiellae bacterium]|nr:FtsW/RodA/SpoVE family cell cycle protein [Kiritimatiellia bacterium]
MSGRDGWLFAAVCALAALGFFLQIRIAETVPGVGFFLPYALGSVCGIAAMFVFSGERADILLRARWIALGVALALLAALLVFGRRYRGGLYLPGRLNPSELVKLCMVVFAAGTLADGRVTPRRLAELGAGYGAVALAVAAAKDFGLLAQLAATGAAVLFAASWFWGCAAFAGLACGVAFMFMRPTGHLATRLAVWRDPLADASGAGWQTLQGLTAVVSGGWWGVGTKLGDVRNVPIVASDFVYTALAEEWGLVGCAAVLALYGVVFVRGLMASARLARAENAGGALLAAGLVASLAVQVLLNIGGVLNAVPMTGIPLPLLSLGGSSLVVTLVSLGILLGLSRTTEEDDMSLAGDACSSRPRRARRPLPQSRREGKARPVGKIIGGARNDG